MLTGTKTTFDQEISEWAAWKEIEDNRVFCNGTEGLGS
jgi:hypothetical protein